MTDQLSAKFGKPFAEQARANLSGTVNAKVNLYSGTLTSPNKFTHLNTPWKRAVRISEGPLCMHIDTLYVCVGNTSSWYRGSQEVTGRELPS